MKIDFNNLEMSEFYNWHLYLFASSKKNVFNRSVIQENPYAELTISTNSVLMYHSFARSSTSSTQNIILKQKIVLRNASKVHRFFFIKTILLLEQSALNPYGHSVSHNGAIIVVNMNIKIDSQSDMKDKMYREMNPKFKFELNEIELIVPIFCASEPLFSK